MRPFSVKDHIVEQINVISSEGNNYDGHINIFFHVLHLRAFLLYPPKVILEDEPSSPFPQIDTLLWCEKWCFRLMGHVSILNVLSDSICVFVSLCSLLFFHFNPLSSSWNFWPTGAFTYIFSESNDAGLKVFYLRFGCKGLHGLKFN